MSEYLKRLITLIRRRTMSTVVILVSCVTLTVIPIVDADSYQQQIDNLNAQNSQVQSSLDGLQAQATSYQDAITKLQQQISALQTAISNNEAEQTQLQAKIDADEAQLQHEKYVLGQDIATMYVNGQMTTVEMLATSKNLSSFIDAETYRGAVQNKLQDLLTQIADLQNQLEAQKTQLQVTLNIQQSQEAQVTNDESQQNHLLSLNQAQQTQYNQQIQANQSQIAALVAEQIAANRKLVGTGQVDYSGSCGGTYPATAQGAYGPWGCNYAHTSDDVQGCAYEDSWGMCNRECVSYTAWMVYKNNGIDVTGFGNANEWPGHARADGIPTGSTPRVGSVAIYMGGSGDPFGHAMWVKSVNGDGSITVDQYNLYYDGNFYETTISGAGLTYIYF